MDGDTCHGKGCCCDGKDSTGLQVATCRTNDNDIGDTNRGCGSCWGNDACTNTAYMNIGTNACRGKSACHNTKYSTIESEACQGNYACYYAENMNIANNACHETGACHSTAQSTIEFEACYGLDSCQKMDNSMIKTGACVGEEACYYLKDSSIGKGSCQGYIACFPMSEYGPTPTTNLSIGNNACNGDNICKNCDSNSVVPSDACNDLNGDDVTNGKCNYCTVRYIWMFYQQRIMNRFPFFV